MIEFMVDLETMGTGNDAAIVAIGAVAFDASNDYLIPAPEGEFYTPISLTSSMEAGLKCDASTILWWLEQEDAARQELTGRTVPLRQALSQLTCWIGRIGPSRPERTVWGNGATADNVWLRSAFKACSMTDPWSYSGDRCYRTMKNMYPAISMPPFDGVKHNALVDARMQALHLLDILRGVRR